MVYQNNININLESIKTKYIDITDRFSLLDEKY